MLLTMAQVSVLCLACLVGPAFAADWKRLKELPEDVSKSEVMIEYTDGSLLIVS